MVGNPAEAWFGFVVELYAALWQEMQSVGVPGYLPPMWQLAQATPVCLPVSANPEVAWLNDAGLQPEVEWQTSHCCGKPEAAWLGLVVFW